MGKPEEVARLFKTVDAEFGALDAFFNNAGILGTASKFVDIAPERLQRIVAVNTVGPFFAAQEAVRRMSTRLGGNGGVIVNMSSMAASSAAVTRPTDYAASKGAIDTLTVGLAKEWRPRASASTPCGPGLIYTDIHASTGDPRPRRPDQGPGADAARRHGRGSGRAVLWLCSDQSTYCTGLLLDIPAGAGQLSSRSCAQHPGPRVSAQPSLGPGSGYLLAANSGMTVAIALSLPNDL